jgi:hypothetical protein
MLLQIQRKYKNKDSYIIIIYFKELFHTISRTESYETFKNLFGCKQDDKSFSYEHVCFIYD